MGQLPVAGVWAKVGGLVWKVYWHWRMARQSLIENQRSEDFGRGNSLREEVRVGPWQSWDITSCNKPKVIS